MFQVGGGLAFKIYLYDPTETSFTAWDRSYSFEIGPGRSYNMKLSTRKFRDYTGFNDCIEEGKMGWVPLHVFIFGPCFQCFH